MDRSKLAASVSHRVNGDRLAVTGRVQNQSKQPVTFVRHPNFYSITVSSADGRKDELHNFQFISFVPARKEDLEVVAPGGSIDFTWEFLIRRPRKGVVDIIEDSGWSEPRFMRIWDSRLRATFHYGIYPDYLPRPAWALGRNYVMVEIAATTVFPRP